MRRHTLERCVCALAILTLSTVIFLTLSLSKLNLIGSNTDIQIHFPYQEHVITKVDNKYGASKYLQELVIDPEDPEASIGAERFECPVVRFNLDIKDLHYPMCVHEAGDQLISGTFLKGDVWDYHFVSMVAYWLADDPRKGLIDIGANIGTFTVAMANLGHSVVAVEPLPINYKRMIRSLSMSSSSVRKNVVVVKGAVSDSRGEVYLIMNKVNRGDVVVVDRKACLEAETGHTHQCNVSQPVRTFYMDDLLEVIHFSRAVIKIDVEGLELKAFRRAARLFQSVYISHVIVEWNFYKTDKYRNPDGWSEVKKFIHFFVSRGFTPHDFRDRNDIIVSDDWFTWPNDIVWIRY